MIKCYLNIYLLLVLQVCPVVLCVPGTMWKEPGTLSDVMSCCGTEPEEYNHRRERKEAEMSTTVVFTTAKFQARWYSSTNGELLGQVGKSPR